MKISKLMGILLLLVTNFSLADELTEKIRIGTGPGEVEAIMGDKPYDTDCSTTLGVRSCRIFFKKADFDKNGFTAYFYEVLLVADRVVSTNVQMKRGAYK